MGSTHYMLNDSCQLFFLTYKNSPLDEWTYLFIDHTFYKMYPIDVHIGFPTRGTGGYV